MFLSVLRMGFLLACVAGGRAKPLEASGEAVRRILAASPLAMSGSAAKMLFHAPTIPPATQARFSQKMLQNGVRNNSL